MKRLLIIMALMLSTSAHAKAKKPKVVKNRLPAVGDMILVTNIYRPQYGCGGKIKKILKNKKKSWYLVDIQSCDVNVFTRLSQLDLSEIVVISKGK